MVSHLFSNYEKHMFGNIPMENHACKYAMQVLSTYLLQSRQVAFVIFLK